MLLHTKQADLVYFTFMFFYISSVIFTDCLSYCSLDFCFAIAALCAQFTGRRAVGKEKAQWSLCRSRKQTSAAPKMHREAGSDTDTECARDTRIAVCRHCARAYHARAIGANPVRNTGNRITG